MPIATWPLTLPEYPTMNYSEDSGVLIIRTPMEMGIAKQRRRAKRPDVLNVSYEMTLTQVQTFDTFVHDTLMGVLRFTIKHPRKQTNVEVRIVPQQDGKLYDLSMLQFNLYSVSMQLEVMP